VGAGPTHNSGSTFPNTMKNDRHARLMPPIVPRWHDGRTVIVAAPGPSLTQEVAERCRNHTVLAIKEAYQQIPWAEVLYGCDEKFWKRTNGCPDFQGERWSSHDNNSNHKLAAARDYGVKLCNGRGGLRFSLDPITIHYSKDSGFQAINLALLFGATRLVLVGFDMRLVGGKRYFFGNDPRRLLTKYNEVAEKFAMAARHLPPHIKIINSTPDSALKCFPRMDLNDALSA